MVCGEICEKALACCGDAAPAEAAALPVKSNALATVSLDWAEDDFEDVSD
jgi:hypothetical protein